MTQGPDTRPVCFIAMPVTTYPDHATLYSDDEHWLHVMEQIFVPAIEEAGFQPLRPISRGSGLIHEDIIQALVASDMVLCDFSQHNPNVLFELGVRTAVNKPVSLVQDERVSRPFDLSGINTHTYDSQLRAWLVKDEIDKLATHIKDSVQKCQGTNPLWQRFGLLQAAEAPSVEGSPADAKLNLLMRSVEELSDTIARMRQNAIVDVRAATLPSISSLPARQALGNSTQDLLGQFNALALQVTNNGVEFTSHDGLREVTVGLSAEAVKHYDPDVFMRLRKALPADWQLKVVAAGDESRTPLTPTFSRYAESSEPPE